MKTTLFTFLLLIFASSQSWASSGSDSQVSSCMGQCIVNDGPNLSDISNCMNMCIDDNSLTGGTMPSISAGGTKCARWVAGPLSCHNRRVCRIVCSAVGGAAGGLVGNGPGAAAGVAVGTQVCSQLCDMIKKCSPTRICAESLAY